MSDSGVRSAVGSDVFRVATLKIRAKINEAANAMSDAFSDDRKILYMWGVSADFVRERLFLDLLSDIFVFHPFEICQ